MQGACRLFLHALWGCQPRGEYAIKGRLIHATQPLFVFLVACDYFGVISRRKRSFDRWDHGLRATAPTQLSLICEVEFLQMMGLPLNKPTPAEEAEAEARHQFAIRANSILAFIECDEEQRPKLREAIIEAMLWAQTQPRLAK